MFVRINGHLFVYSYIMVKRDCFLLVSSDFHFRSSSRYVTLDLLWYRCLTHLAPLRWTISILLMSTLSCGSQTQLANSTVGLIIELYAVSLVLVDAIFKFLLNNPRVLFALVVTEVISWPQSKVLLVITQRNTSPYDKGRWLEPRLVKECDRTKLIRQPPAMC